jgi:ribonuclease T1
MRTRWWWSSLCVAALLACAGGPANAREQQAAPAASIVEIELSHLPREAQETLALIKRGGPFPFRKDGSIFTNREQRLPTRARGYYAEYTVRTPGSRDRGPRRIVAGKGASGNFATSGEYYYTDDHYETFRRIRAH